MPVAGTPVDSSNIKGLKDVLMTYNEITLSCFTKCTTSFNSHSLTLDEADCVENCCNKMIRGNHSMMAVFMEVQSRKQEELFKETAKRQEQAMLNEGQQISALGAPDSVLQK